MELSSITNYAPSSRIDGIIQKFGEAFDGEEPEYFVRAPGRVNLIGEHVDYCGYSVLPMAISRDIIIAFRRVPNSKKLRLANSESVAFPVFEISLASTKDIDIDTSKHGWHNYVLCGVKGALLEAGLDTSTGLEGLVDGTVPKGSGLSSSSALVCASTLLASQANALGFSAQRIAEIAIKSERFIGVESGGMDQSISMLAEAGFAKHIAFDPIRTENVKLPSGLSWVVSNSLVESHKKETAATNYNLRVVECRLAAQLLAKRLGEKIKSSASSRKARDLLLKDWKSIRTLADVQTESGYSLEQLAAFTQESITQGSYTVEELESKENLGVPVSSLMHGFQAAGSVFASVKHFNLRSRAYHVYTEALRVAQFKATCADESLSREQKIQVVGRLMNESHASCAYMFECSCKEVDILGKVCIDAGAIGSRVTGAGWGGCVISVIPEEITEKFIDTVQKNYYAPLAATKALPPQSEYLFATLPSASASVSEHKVNVALAAPARAEGKSVAAESRDTSNSTASPKESSEGVSNSGSTRHLLHAAIGVGAAVAVFGIALLAKRARSGNNSSSGKSD